MSQYKKPDNSLPLVELANASTTVKVLGIDATAGITTGDTFHAKAPDGSFEAVPYTVAAPPTFDATDTLVPLSAPYAGATRSTDYGVFDNSYTSPDNYPVPAAGDVDTLFWANRFANKSQEITTGIKNGTLTPKHAREVGRTTRGSGTSAGHWSKVATITSPSSLADGVYNLKFIIGYTGDKPYSVMEVAIHMMRLSSAYTARTKADIISISGDGFRGPGCVKLVAATTGSNTLEVWIQKTQNYGAVKTYEIAKNDEIGEIASIEYHDLAPWQAAAPTGAVNITSDWAGSGIIQPTCGNGWTTGDIELEKSADGWVTIRVESPVAGTTTDGIIVTTLSAGYLPGASSIGALDIKLSSSTGVTNGGKFSLNTTTGVITIIGYVSGGFLRGSLTYRARG